MKRNRSLSPPAPSLDKRRRLSHMPISDTHPVLKHIDSKVERRKRCNDLISAIVKKLAPHKPRLQKTCPHPESLMGPFLNLGVDDLTKAGEYRQMVWIINSDGLITTEIIIVL